MLDIDLLQSTLGHFRQIGASEPPGTLLMQDADELPAAAQALVCEFMQNARQPVLVIAVARQSLSGLAHAGKYRHDLACLASTVEIRLPSLSERLEDLPLLAQWFLEEENRRGGKQVGGLSPDALDWLARHTFRGELDELRTLIAEAHRACSDAQVELADLPPEVQMAADAAEYARRPEETIVLEEFLARIETELITRALDRAKGNKTRAARLLGMTRPRLYRRLVQLGLIEEGIDFKEV